MTPPPAYFHRAASAHTSISTGKERDSESGNDYFGARYYASSMGRRMSQEFRQPVQNEGKYSKTGEVEIEW
jgi:hypothetical protein